MSVNIFKPELWSRTILNELDTMTSMRKHSDYRFNQEIKYGTKLHITEAGGTTIRDYTPGVDIQLENADGKDVVLEITERKYFAKYYDDVDMVQSIKGVMENDMKQSAKELRLTADKFVANKLKDGIINGVTFNSDEAGKSETRKIKCSEPYTVAKSTIVRTVEDGLTYLYSMNVTPETEIWGEFSPVMYSYMREYLTELATSNLDLMKRGIIGRYNNVNITIENVLPNNTVNGQFVRYNFLRTGKAFAFAEQIDKIRATEKERGFGDIVKGLYVYGGVIVRPYEAYAIAEKCATDVPTI